MGELRSAYSRLGAAQKKRARGAPAYSVYVNRPVGRVLAAASYTLGATPNAVTAASALLTFAGIAFIVLAPATVPVGILIAALLCAGYAMDSADGQVARLRGGGSPAGEWLDHFVDAVKTVSLPLATLVGIFRWDDEVTPWLLLPLVFAVVASTTFFGMILNDLLRQKQGVVTSAERGGASPVRSLLLLPVDYGVLCLVYALWGLHGPFLVVYAALIAAHTAFLLAASVRWFREMTRLDERGSL